ncbi:hypothetical protein HFN60_05385 [Rhizobium leguminosarum]|nr:hypothetical protein [Rhizobium leguminosarum]
MRICGKGGSFGSAEKNAVGLLEQCFGCRIQEKDGTPTIDQHGRIRDCIDQPLRQFGCAGDPVYLKGKIDRPRHMRAQPLQPRCRFDGVLVLLTRQEQSDTADTSPLVQAGMRQEELIEDVLRLADIGVKRGMPDGLCIDQSIADCNLARLYLLECAGIGVARVMLKIERIQIFAHAARDQKAAAAIGRLIDNISGDGTDVINDRTQGIRP